MTGIVSSLADQLGGGGKVRANHGLNPVALSPPLLRPMVVGLKSSNEGATEGGKEKQ